VLAVFSVEGLLDFVLVLYTGLTAVPLDGPLQNFHPFFLIPVLAVPLFILVHVYAIRAMINRRGAGFATRHAPKPRGAHA